MDLECVILIDVTQTPLHACTSQWCPCVHMYPGLDLAKVHIFEKETEGARVRLGEEEAEFRLKDATAMKDDVTSFSVSTPPYPSCPLSL